MPPAATPFSNGDKIGRWTVLDNTIRLPRQVGTVLACLVQCECGKQSTLPHSKLRSGRSLSCGCLRTEQFKAKYTKHAAGGTRLYGVWAAMKRRCYTPTVKEYHRYGGAGISVCDEWRTSFIAFREWAMNNGYQDSLSIDRINGTGNYEPSNCRWATYEIQANNQKSNHPITAFGETKNLTQWSRDSRCSVGHARISIRLKEGWLPEDAISFPPSKPHSYKNRTGV